MKTRRRGAELEEALLEAAWQELEERGYAGLTMENVATRAGTSRPVIARRWRSKAELTIATLRHQIQKRQIWHRKALDGRIKMVQEKGLTPLHLDWK